MSEPRRVNGYPVTPPTRWTKASNGRLLPLNSAAWKKLRRSVLNEAPLCQYCPPGTLTPADTVDHANNNPADNTRTNLVSCCASCHSRKTASDMHGKPARMGCNADGWPTNPAHGWNAAAVEAYSGLAGHHDDVQEVASSQTLDTDLYSSL